MPIQQLPVTGLDDLQMRRRHRETTNKVLSHDFDDSRRRTPEEIAAGITPVNQAYPPGHAKRYGAIGDGTTDDTGALQRWLDSGHKDLYLPAATYIASNLTARFRCFIYGDGPRMSVIRQSGSASGALLSFETGLPPTGGANDITEGVYRLEDFGLQPRASSGCHGISAAAGGLYCMLRTSNLRIQNQHSESLGSPPYSVTSGTRGINVDGGGSGAALMAHHVNLEIRSCETAIYARNVVNEWHIHGWFIDCLAGYDLDDCSTWRSFVSHESGVEDACAWRLDDVSNVVAIGERWELTQNDSYGVEFVSGATLSNIHFMWPNVLISSDGSAWPGRKYLNLADGTRGASNGTLVAGCLFYVNIGSPADPIIFGNNDLRLPSTLLLGGSGFGAGTLTVDRSSGGAPSDFTTSSDGFCEVYGTNGIRSFVNAVQTMRLDDSSAAGNVRMLVYDVDNGQLERVSVGAADSGGAGFKVLRIPN